MWHFYHVTVEMLKILSMDCKNDEFSSVHHKFLDHLWEVFNAVCRSLNELRYLVSCIAVLLFTYLFISYLTCQTVFITSSS